MKKINLNIAFYSFVFSLFITSIIAVLSYFYIQESIATLKIQEKYRIESYANKITKNKRTIQDFKEFTFGTVESFLYQIAIVDKSKKVLYSTFENLPKHEYLQNAYIEGDSVLYDKTTDFLQVGAVTLLMEKKLDYADIENRAFILIVSILTLLLMFTIFLYLHSTKIHNIMNKNLDLFLKDAMHEIRTPLGVIQINLEFLENTVHSSMALKRAQGGLRNLTSVYESIEYFIKNEKILYKKEIINLSPLLRDRIEFFNILADIKNQKINSFIEENIFINANFIEMQRLIDNNLSNAIKYSKENTQIEIKLYKDIDSALLVFSNHGDEIKDIKKIFQRYYRGDNIRGGFGLGLNMVEHICNKYHININVSSSSDGNSIFTYKMPSIMLKKETKYD